MKNTLYVECTHYVKNTDFRNVMSKYETIPVGDLQERSQYRGITPLYIIVQEEVLGDLREDEGYLLNILHQYCEKMNNYQILSHNC